MFRLVPVELGQRATGERQARRLNGILMGYEDQWTGRGQPVPLHGVSNPPREGTQRLGREREVFRMIQVGGEFAGEQLVE